MPSTCSLRSATDPLDPVAALHFCCSVTPRPRLRYDRCEGTVEDETEKRTDHAARIGSRVGIGCIAAVVLLLVATIYPSVPLMLAVCAMSVPQALFAARVGRVLGPKIAAGSILRAVPIGALAGCFVLGSTGMTASVIGLFWGLHDGIRGKDWAYSYIGKPLVAVVFYGFFLAIPLGILGGLVIWSLTRVWNRSPK